jgi:hypothetical protein
MKNADFRPAITLRTVHEDKDGKIISDETVTIPIETALSAGIVTQEQIDELRIIKEEEA